VMDCMVTVAAFGIQFHQTLRDESNPLRDESSH
jgi:hypothetical protein